MQAPKAVIVGTLHSDDQASACMPLDRGKPTWRVQFEQSLARADYIWHLYDITRYFVGTPPRVFVLVAAVPRRAPGIGNL